MSTVLPDSIPKSPRLVWEPHGLPLYDTLCKKNKVTCKIERFQGIAPGPKNPVTLPESVRKHDIHHARRKKSDLML